MKSIPTRVVPLVIALGFSVGALAQTGATGSGASPAAGAAPAAQPGTGTRNTETRKDDALARADRKFIQEAAEHGMFEVQIAELASSKASNADVKSFATTLANDHKNANNELVQLANSKKIEVPAAPPRAKRNEIEKLGKLTGAEFDRRFVRNVGIKEHEKGIKKFEKASEKTKDPQLKAWIDKTLPKLREHLAAAQKLPLSGVDASAMGGAAAPATTGPAGGKSGANKTGS